MVRVKKRKSKRVSTKQRVKVEKKVREHHRKSRREAKRDPTWKSKKKADPGIPNSLPFKEQILDEIQMARDRQEQRKIELREARAAERKKGVVAEEEQDSEDEVGSVVADEDEEDGGEPSGSAPSKPVLAPVYAGSIETLLDDEEVANLVLVLDARDPQAWRAPSLESAALAKGKKVHLAIAKTDLVPLESLVSHVHMLSSLSTVSVHPVSTRSPASIAHLVTALKKSGGRSGGSAFVGFENSGRSSLATLVMAERGEDDDTRISDTHHLLRSKKAVNDAESDSEDEEDEDEDDADEAEEEDEMSLVDLVDGGDPHEEFEEVRQQSLRTLFRNKGKIERIKEPIPPIWSLMPLVAQPEDLMMLYSVPAFGSHRIARVDTDALTEDGAAAVVRAQLDEKIRRDSDEFLIGLAKVQGRTKKKGIPDASAAARVVLRDWCSGCVGYYSTANGWTQIPKAEREAISASCKAQLSTLGLQDVVLTRREWRKNFVERQRERKDLHASPAIGELRLRSAGPGALAGSEEQDVEFWKPYASVEDLVGLDGDDDDDAEMSDEDLESDVPDLNDDDEDEEEADEEEASEVEEAPTALPSRRAQKQQQQQQQQQKRSRPSPPAAAASDTPLYPQGDKGDNSTTSRKAKRKAKKVEFAPGQAVEDVADEEEVSHSASKAKAGSRTAGRPVSILRRTSRGGSGGGRGDTGNGRSNGAVNGAATASTARAGGKRRKS